MFPQGWFLLEIPRGHSVLFPFMAARNCLSNLSCDPHFPVLKVSHSSLCFPHLSSCGDYIFQVRSSHPTPTPTDPCSSRQSRITSLPLPTSFDHICKALVTIEVTLQILGIRMWVWEPLFSLPQFPTTARSTFGACIPLCCEA